MQSCSVLRKLIEERRTIVTAGAWDALTARIAERVGFEMTGIPGYSFGFALGVPEPLTTMTEMLNIARTIVNAVKIPVSVDAGAGYGEPVHVVRTVREFERAGVAGITLEDAIFPKRAHYHKLIEHLIPMDQMIDKIRFAVKARENPDFVITARTDACRVYDFDEAVKRANAYVDAGADMITLSHSMYRSELEQAPKLIKAPLTFTNSPGHKEGKPCLTLQEAERLGYKIYGEANTAIAVVLGVVKKLYGDLKRTGSTGVDPEEMRALKMELEDIGGLPSLYRIEEETTEKK